MLGYANQSLSIMLHKHKNSFLEDRNVWFIWINDT